MGRYRYAVVCASNQNRSMEAHSVLNNCGCIVSSYGTGSAVRLPGPSIDKPNVYEFGTPYQAIYEDLSSKDIKLYTANGLLHMLDRNRKIKTAPERFQEDAREQKFDVIITCEEKVFDAVCEDLMSRDVSLTTDPVHIINVEIKDNHEEALVGGQVISDMAKRIEQSNDIDSELDGVIEEFVVEHRAHALLHAVCFH